MDWLFVLGLALLAAGAWSAGYLALMLKRRRVPKRLRIGFVAATIAGAALAVTAAFFTASFTYDKSDTLRILGLPFPVAFFQRDGDHWLDFVGPLSPVFWVANLLVPAMLPVIPLAIAVRIAHHKAG